MAELTQLQQAFAEHYAECGNAAEAARKAGYSPTSAGSIGSELLRSPRVAAEIQRALARLKNRSGALGLSALVEIATNPKAAAAARVAAARALLEHGGLIGSARDVERERDDVENEATDMPDAHDFLERLAKARSAA